MAENAQRLGSNLIAAVQTGWERLLSWLAPVAEPEPARPAAAAAPPQAAARPQPAAVTIRLPTRIGGMIAAIFLLQLIVVAALAKLLQASATAGAAERSAPAAASAPPPASAPRVPPLAPAPESPPSPVAEAAPGSAAPLDSDRRLIDALLELEEGIDPPPPAAGTAAAAPAAAAQTPLPVAPQAAVPAAPSVPALPALAAPARVPPPQTTEPAATVPAPPAAAPVAQPSPASTSAEPDAAPSSVTLPAADVHIKDASWVRAQNPRHYTLQLLSANQARWLDKFVDQHALRGDVAYIRSTQGGTVLYSLLYGIYPTRAEAMDAARALMDRLHVERPWARTLASVQAQLQDEARSIRAVPPPEGR